MAAMALQCIANLMIQLHESHCYIAAYITMYVTKYVRYVL